MISRRRFFKGASGAAGLAALLSLPRLARGVEPAQPPAETSTAIKGRTEAPA